MKLTRLIGFGSSFLLSLQFVANALAQEATSSGSKGGTEGALPDAGTTELTYLIFVAGVLFFVFGTLKLIASYRE